MQISIAPLGKYLAPAGGLTTRNPALECRWSTFELFASGAAGDGVSEKTPENNQPPPTKARPGLSIFLIKTNGHVLKYQSRFKDISQKNQNKPPSTKACAGC